MAPLSLECGNNAVLLVAAQPDEIHVDDRISTAYATGLDTGELVPLAQCTNQFGAFGTQAGNACYLS